LFGYYPSNRDEDGRWRTIAVRATRPGVRLFTRSGYYAGRDRAGRSPPLAVRPD